MIIKKKYAQAPPAAPPVASPSSYSMSADSMVSVEPIVAPPADPYEDITREDIDAGRLSDRRRNDRRQGYRRVEDQELISRAHEEAIAIREAAEQAGFEEGLNRAQGMLDELQYAIQSFLNAREEALASAGDALAAMAVDIAKRIIKTEVSCDEELIMYMVRDTIRKVGREQKRITVKVSPSDYRYTKDAVKTDPDMLDDVQVIVEEDESVDPGSCMIESQAGLIDARFSTQLELLNRILATGKA
jgi:flagellar biosynthesis/type III secretory pathway protein FliH